jgi:hypothetical protein
MVRLDDELAPYVRAIEETGRAPIPSMLDALATRDLIIFDDAVHNAVEPFEFYQQMVRDQAFQELAPTIFIEPISINQQPHVDAYFATTPEDPTLLYPAFQNNFSGYGWRYQTYFDLLHAIYEVNQSLPADRRLNVVGVANPTYWCEIHTARDYELFTQRALLSFDYSMYQIILAELDHFESGRKGVFFTNTRHAYKGVRRPDDSLHWNLGTFFAQHHPGKTWSVRCHNVFLSITPKETPPTGKPRSAEGLDDFDIGWVRPARGLWDAAFAAHANRPVVVPLAGTPFGTDPYLGNHMRSAAPGSTMLDAYDAVLFLGPLETLRQSAISDAIITPDFMPELVRRHRILNDEASIRAAMDEAGVDTVEALLRKTLTPRAETLSAQSQAAGPADEWRDTK